MSDDNRISAEKRIDAPVEKVFSLLADPSRHPEIDASGMLVELATPGKLTGVGNVFTMRMNNSFMGKYTIDNRVIAFDPNRHIAWEPVLSSATRREDDPYIGVNLNHRWGYKLEAIQPTATMVTEYFDCSRSPASFQEELQGGQIWKDAIATSLENIQKLLA